MKQYPEGKEANKNNGLLLFLKILLQIKESRWEGGKTVFAGLFLKMARADIFIPTHYLASQCKEAKVWHARSSSVPY